MAMPRTWVPRADEIVEVLRRMKSRHLDRPVIEELFQLQRRQAITIMKQNGAVVERGGAFLVERTSLLSWVERISKEEAWQLERRQTTADELSQSMAEVQAVRAALHVAGKPLVSFPIVDEVLQARITYLPAAIEIEPGRITVHADDPEPRLPRLAGMPSSVRARDRDDERRHNPPSSAARI
jgi:hypothetical protein